MKLTFTIITILCCINICVSQNVIIDTIKANCEEHIYQIPPTASAVTVTTSCHADVLLKEYDSEGRSIVEYTQTMLNGLEYSIDSDHPHDVIISGCDSICKEIFEVIQDSEFFSVIDFDGFSVGDYVNDTCEYLDIIVVIDIEYQSGIYPNPTSNINNTIQNMKNVGYQPISFHSTIGKPLTNHEVQRMKEGALLLTYIYENRITGVIEKATEKIIVIPRK